MSHTVIPSVKGQITIPVPIRNKYHITQETPVIIEDNGKGIITMRIMRMVEDDLVKYYETAQEKGLHFKHGIDPQVLIDEIKKIDG